MNVTFDAKTQAWIADRAAKAGVTQGAFVKNCVDVCMTGSSVFVDFTNGDADGGQPDGHQ